MSENIKLVVATADDSFTMSDVSRTDSVKMLMKAIETKLASMYDGEQRVTALRSASESSPLSAAGIVGDVLSDGATVHVEIAATVSGLRSKQKDAEAMVRPRTSSTVSDTRMDFNITVPLSTIDNTETRIQQAEKMIKLDGRSLTSHDLLMIAQGRYCVQLTRESEQRVIRSRKMLDEIVAENKVVYGITTGFGNFANVRISNENLIQLQKNLIRSHCCGVGVPLTLPRTRALLALRINVLAKGYGGISIENLRRMVEALNASCLSYVPEQGTVGCSGDLAQLAHLALGLMGEGNMWSPHTGWGLAKEVLATNNLQPIELGPKEGITMINGTQMVTSLGAEAIERARAIAHQADVIAALTLDVLKGTTTAFDADIHRLRPHTGQQAVAARLRALLHSENNISQIAESHRMCNKVQDSYTLRCVPQVHGIVHDTIEFVKSIIAVELNSATDNPLVFADRGEIMSGGNFHGEYPAKALDYLAIGISELAQISERRLERLMNPTLSALPAFLAKDGGLNSGFMMVQVTAAALVSENKVLCHPSSCDSIPTSCNQEDHVSMGGFAARKCLRVIDHVEQVLAMELLAATQGMEFLKPLESTPPLQRVYEAVRASIPAYEKDRVFATDINTAVKLLRQEKIWQCVAGYLHNQKNSNPIQLERPNTMESPTAYRLANPFVFPKTGNTGQSTQ